MSITCLKHLWGYLTISIWNRQGRPEGKWTELCITFPILFSESPLHISILLIYPSIPLPFFFPNLEHPPPTMPVAILLPLPIQETFCVRNNISPSSPIFPSFSPPPTLSLFCVFLSFVSLMRLSYFFVWAFDVSPLIATKPLKQTISYLVSLPHKTYSCVASNVIKEAHKYNSYF